MDNFTGPLKLVGTFHADVLYGSIGNDTFIGYGGGDVLYGYSGDDLYYVENTKDRIVEKFDDGQDLVVSEISYTLSKNVEDLTLEGMMDVDATGNDLNNVLIGNLGDNFLDGGLGIDTMIGGLGDDSYYVDSLFDSIIETSDQGSDTIISYIDYALIANFENLILVGDAVRGTGSDIDNKITGQKFANTLYGLGGNDTIDGGQGADTMIGGVGDDLYYVDNTHDVVTEEVNQGRDTVYSTISYVLGDNVEDLTLKGQAKINATGNSLSNTIIGNNANNIIDGGLGADYMAGSHGNDTYFVDNAGDDVFEYSDSGVDTVLADIATYTLTENVENLTSITNLDFVGTGNALNNIIISGSGEDTLDGAAGSDIMIGGDGNDTYYVDAAPDVVVEKANQGNDTIFSSITYTLANNIENINLTGVEDIDGKGNSLNNAMTGNSGNNILNGLSGADTMIGGLGDDIYYVEDIGDLVLEDFDEGTDTVNSSITYVLEEDLENLILTGSKAINGEGNDSDNYLKGNSAKNILTGYGGNDTIDGALGTDTMIGGVGDDTYYVNVKSDLVVESSNQGTDTVYSSTTYTLIANVENLTLTGKSSINGTGNELNNYITGNSGKNKLISFAGNDTIDGGLGADTMTGGVGNDAYYVDNTKDSVIENVGEGVDTVNSSITYMLVQNVENLTLIGTGTINGTGNELNNYITGNSKNNILTGGIGADTMAGGLGDDIYEVENAGDLVVENLDEGTDLVNSSITYTLTANTENLNLLGTAALNGTGNALDNFIKGNSAANNLSGLAGNDTLDGAGGADTMLGGLGDDSYYVDNNADSVIENLNEGTDTVNSSISYTLTTNTENLVLGAGTAALNGTGNASDNYLTGNSLTNTLIGLAGNDTIDGGTGADTMSGGLGNDVYYVENTGDLVVENLNEGNDTVYSSITYTLVNNVENVILTGLKAIDVIGNDLDNNMMGNSANNSLSGLGGNDTIDGGLGADTMIGGLGNDTYYVENTKDSVIEDAGAGTDLVYSTITYTLGDNVENLTLTGTKSISGTGNELNNYIIGNSAANTLIGLAGNDTLDGGLGADVMQGGLGDDTYYVDNLGDVVKENNELGTDIIYSSVTYTLSSYVENLTLTGSDSISGTGNGMDNIIIGNSGNNTLKGGTGADTMQGELGDDTYIVDNIADSVVENANAGTDSVISSATFTLGANIENLTLTGSTAINGTGNDLDNNLIGNDGANTLTGLGGNDTIDGGLGADTMIGGLGDDTYYVSTTADVVTENLNEGTDIVYSYATYTLGFNIENLTLTKTSAIDGTGNELNNHIIGNSNNNVIDGGIGIDTMEGGLGDDTYKVNVSGDVIIEKADEGTDTVVSVATYTLSDNLENLQLIGSNGISGTGNLLDNDIKGNAGANSLTGLAGNDTLDGGTGADTMTGGLGDDTYVVDNAGDVVVENASEGTDTVDSYLTYILGDNFENLKLMGTDTLSGTGNSVANYLTGNASANILIGLDGNDTIDGGAGNDSIDGGNGNDSINGGAGIDTMVGGLGDDTYTVSVAADVIIENIGEGIDTVNSAITYTLGDNVEKLILTDAMAINGTGNILDNSLTGNTGANTLTGLAGNDTYIINKSGGADTIVDSDGASDLLSFGTEILKADVILYESGNNIIFDYKNGNQVTLQDQKTAATAVEKIQLNDGSYLTSDIVNNLIQQMATYASDNGIEVITAAVIRDNQYLTNLIINSWQSA